MENVSTEARRDLWVGEQLHEDFEFIVFLRAKPFLTYIMTRFGALRFAHKYHALRNQLVAISSPDGGATWRVEEHSAGFPQYEPAVLLHDRKFLFVTRDQTKVRAKKQMRWSPGEKPEIVDTNLEDPRYVDTVDFSFNPVTKRVEVVRSERHRMQLWLWSMNPNDWEKGQWQREFRLLDHRAAVFTAMPTVSIRPLP